MKPKKVFAIVVLAVIGSVLLAIVSSPAWMGWLLRHSQNVTYEAIKNVTLECGLGTKQTIEGWSKAGLSVSCRKGEIIHGPWQAWQAGRLVIKGEFTSGQRSGTWLVYSNEGTLYRTIEYKRGKEISNVIHKAE